MSQYFPSWEGLLLHTAAGRYNSGSSRWTPERTQSSCAETAGRITLQAATASMCRVAHGPATRAPSAAWLRQGQGLVSTHTVGARADITAHYQHSHSRRRPEGSSSSCRLCWRAHGAASQDHTAWAGSPWGGVLSGSFPGRSAPFHLPHTTAWSQIWGRQALGAPSHVGSPGLRWQHNHFDPRSHNTLAPSVILVLGLGQTQRRKGHNLGLLLGRTSDACTGGA